MFRSRSPFFNFVMNFLISCVLFYAFSQVGWITINAEQPIWVIALIVILVNILVSLFVTFGLVFLLPFILFLSCCTLGLGAFLLSGAISYVILAITGSITGLFALSTVWWQALVIGLSFSLLRFSTPSND